MRMREKSTGEFFQFDMVPKGTGIVGPKGVWVDPMQSDGEWIWGCNGSKTVFIAIKSSEASSRFEACE